MKTILIEAIETFTTQKVSTNTIEISEEDLKKLNSLEEDKKSDFINKLLVDYKIEESFYEENLPEDPTFFETCSTFEFQKLQEL